MPGETIALGLERTPRVELAAGFSYPEAQGVWTDGDQALMVLHVDALDETVGVAFLVNAFTHPANPLLEVDVTVNGAAAETWSFAYPSSPSWRRVRAGVASANGVLVVGFTIRAPRSPSELGGNDDRRRLGLMFFQIAVTDSRGSDQAM